jgi:predicted ATP-grasp superfamily ATP-dependent carboligase
MRNPDELYELLTDEIEADSPVLVHALTGFLDAGQAGRLAVDHLLATREHHTVASFDLDDLYDYRARRPRMTFLTDHFAAVDLPTLELVEVTDAAGTPFLLLHGAEPDHAWQRLTQAVGSLVERFGVRLTIGMHAIPWPVPHTRPVDVTAHATDSALIGGHTPWVGSLEVPGHLAGMLELYLGDTGHDAMGFAAHVPHYLVNSEYPSASLALLRHVSTAAGLSLPGDALTEAAEAALAEISAQIAQNPENAGAVEALEAQYDAVATARELGAVDDESPVDGDGEPMPSASELPSGDEIAAQVERFLADMDSREE